MSTIYWLGRAQAIAQVSTYLVTAPIVAAETFSVTINAKAVSFVATTTTAAHVAAGLAAALTASAIPEFREITWTSDGDYLIATAKVAGVPHTISVSHDSAGGDFAIDSTISATGPNFWNNVDNWAGGVVPVTGDSIVLADSNQGILYGWPGSAAVLVDVNVQSTFSGAGVGLPETNTKGYREYRPTFPTNVTLTTGIIAAENCQRFNITGLAASAVLSLEGGTFRLKGSLSDSIIDANAGTTLFMGGPGFTSLAATVRVSASSALYLDKDSTITALSSAGTIVLYGTVTALTVLGGNGVSAKNPATTHIRGGEFKANGSQTFTVLSIGPGTLDLTEDLSAFAITALTLRKGARINNPNSRISGSVPVTLDLVTDLRC